MLLVAYFFEITSSRTKIPSVILLLLLGWGAKQTSMLLKLQIPDLSTLLPIFGTIGLILIVLEGSLELELKKEKRSFIEKSFFVAFIPMCALAFLSAFLFNFFGDFSFKKSLINVIPLCIISSAIAIPSVKNLSTSNKEFVIYESSMSDILGVLFFDFMVLNEAIELKSFGHFALNLLVIFVISFIATIILSYLLRKIDHHIKFAPIIILVVLIYTLSKIYHLPGLIFILLFGLFIGNIDELKDQKLIKLLQAEKLDKEVQRFKDILIEGTFLIRSFFFILFGYLINTAEIINTETLGLAIAITGGIFLFRFILLKASKLPLKPLLFIAPRGLITILLFFAIPSAQVISLVNKSLVIQIIILTAVVMMIGLMINKNEKINSLQVAKNKDSVDSNSSTL
ncbi:cation:proton antiporter [Solitalea koreensis]|uniref:cation:proton antiporter n=1 Tax=Solitalea koreensis TaxID=543615 RepID=UPI001C8F5821|nr:cation:proton antiporter [Solitalea koreensis]